MVIWGLARKGEIQKKDSFWRIQSGLNVKVKEMRGNMTDIKVSALGNGRVSAWGKWRASQSNINISYNPRAGEKIRLREEREKAGREDNDPNLLAFWD